MHSAVYYSRSQKDSSHLRAASTLRDPHLVWHVQVSQDDVKGISTATLLNFVHGLLPIHCRHDVGVPQALQDPQGHLHRGSASMGNGLYVLELAG